MNPSEFFQTDNDWLEEQPTMIPWQEGCHRLWRHLHVWIRRYTPELCAEPVTPEHPGHAGYRDRYWRCWHFHWQPGLHVKDKSKRKHRITDGCRAAIKTVRKEDGTSLLRDVTLAEAVTQTDRRAIELFVKEHGPGMRQIAMKTSKRFADEAYSDILNECFGAPGQRGRLAGYSGQRRLRSYLATTVTREVWRYARKHKKQKPLRALEDGEVAPADGLGIRDRPENAAANKESKQVIWKWFHRQTPESRLLLRYRLVSRTKLDNVDAIPESGEPRQDEPRLMILADIGRILGIDKGNVQKRFKSLLHQLKTEPELKNLPQQDLIDLLVNVLHEVDREVDDNHNGGDER